MALSILDGNQSQATLSTIVTGGQHISAHTVVSLGTQAITDMRGAVSGSVVSISNFPASQTIAGTVTANLGTIQVKNFNNVITSGYFKQAFDESLQVSGMGDDGAVLSQISSVFGLNLSSATGSLPISGTVTIGNSVTIGSALPAGTNRIGVVTVGGGSVTLGAGTAQIGSVTASISGTVTLGESTAQIGSVTVSNISSLLDAGNNPVIRTFMFGYDYVNDQPVAIANDGTSLSVAGSVTIGSALPAGTAQIGSVTASISNSVVTFYPMQGTTVTNSNFTSTTASTTLVSAVAGREVLTVFNEGAGNLHISPGATCTTISYQVRLSSGDYWECPAGQTSLAHTAVFNTAGTARVSQVS